MFEGILGLPNFIGKPTLQIIVIRKPQSVAELLGVLATNSGCKNNSRSEE